MRIYLLFFVLILLFALEVNSENCEFNGWVIPNISPQGTIFMNGSWWSVEEFSIQNGIMRKVERLDVEPPENGQLLPIEQALALATEFIEENRDDLGIPESVEIVVEQTTNYPLSLTLFNFDQQECNGVPVVNSFAGILTVGDYGVFSLGFMWYPSFNIQSTSPGIGAGQASSIASSNSQPELKILPTEEGNFKLIWDVNGTYVDAQKGDILDEKGNKEIKQIDPKNKNVYKWLIFIGIIVLFIATGLLIKSKKR
ncbi:MAG: hypothetical protein V1663_01900 [archaeon]